MKCHFKVRVCCFLIVWAHAWYRGQAFWPAFSGGPVFLRGLNLLLQPVTVTNFKAWSERPTQLNSTDKLWPLHPILCANTLWVRKKQETLLMSITSWNFDRFSKFFHCLTKHKIFYKKWSMYIPPYLSNVAVQPCKTIVFQKSHKFQNIVHVFTN